ncbi:hypothetical protein [Bacteroides cutis]|uniref:hypothetical protein n=1 Tax=Bacteroides cutis TaxID=2024197 RepID=UPI0011AFB6D7|nr:hypothetical protein [Bacteroides cutis]
MQLLPAQPAQFIVSVVCQQHLRLVVQLVTGLFQPFRRIVGIGVHFSMRRFPCSGVHMLVLERFPAEGIGKEVRVGTAHQIGGTLLYHPAIRIIVKGGDDRPSRPSQAETSCACQVSFSRGSSVKTSVISAIRFVGKP